LGKSTKEKRKSLLLLSTTQEIYRSLDRISSFQTTCNDITLFVTRR